MRLFHVLHDRNIFNDRESNILVMCRRFIFINLKIYLYFSSEENTLFFENKRKSLKLHSLIIDLNKVFLNNY
jgi:hypothetical protein